MKPIRLIAPIRIESLNVVLRMHPLARHRANNAASQKVRHMFWLESMMLHRIHPQKLLAEWGEVDVHLTRIGLKRLDGDNLQGGLKHIRDCIAECLGVDDANPCVTWTYEQQVARDFGLEVVIAKRTGGAA